jgi:hypothetical protein
MADMWFLREELLGLEEFFNNLNRRLQYEVARAWSLIFLAKVAYDKRDREWLEELLEDLRRLARRAAEVSETPIGYRVC